jgi:hypothetical protein
MRLDHVSYVASHDQISDVVNRIGAQIGTAFVDGGIHPKFGTRNFTAPLLNGQYIEVVCPLDHPATDTTPFGQAVKNKAQDGGGWLAWIFSADDISDVEVKLGRKAVLGYRTRPDGTQLEWKQIGINQVIVANEFPFFIQWLTLNHPSLDGKAVAKIKGIDIASENRLANSLFKSEIEDATSEIDIKWKNPEEVQLASGILNVTFDINSKDITIE